MSTLKIKLMRENRIYQLKKIRKEKRSLSANLHRFSRRSVVLDTATIQLWVNISNVKFFSCCVIVGIDVGFLLKTFGNTYFLSTRCFILNFPSFRRAN